jgi:undecaprenyl-diphosphatase
MHHGIDMLQTAVLALIQGLTEFLPISSTAHLALVPLLTGWPDQGLAFDCVVHLGTLTAVILYFRTELGRMASGFGKTITARSWHADADGRMVWFIGLATIPVGLAGLAFKPLVEQALRSELVIGAASVGFGLLLWWADRRGRRSRHDGDWRLGQALLVGLAQAVALIPGTSRSGITMTAALMLGYTRESAAHFSFMLSIPVIALSGGLAIHDWMTSPSQTFAWHHLLAGYALSAVSAYLCIHFFLKFIQRIGMVPFALYRIVLGTALLIAAHSAH